VIAVFGGTGQQGRGIVQRLARAGRSVLVASRDPARAAAAVAAWPDVYRGLRCLDYGSATAEADILIVAVPFESVAALFSEHGGRLKDRALIVDVTVPLTFTGGKAALLDVAEGSAAEHIKSRLPAHARLAVAFKTVPAHMLNQVDQPLDCDEFVCGDSPEARSEASALVETVQGLRAVDVGPLARARAIEHLTLLAIGINRRHKIHDARFRIVGL
jgi:NADPH-dependent F420 reductase